MSKRILTADEINITPEELRSMLDYDQETGVFKWLVARSSKVKIGSIAGGKNKKGYVQIQIKKKLLTAHRLAIMWVTGKWPDCEEIDHINGNRSDNRLANLRTGTQGQNQQNVQRARKFSKTGLLGVSVVNTGGFTANIQVDGKKKYLGFFNSPEEAHNAYLLEKRQIHKFCTI